MVIEKYLIYFKKPIRCVYWGEKGIEIVGLPENKKTPPTSKIIENLSIPDVTSEEFRPIIAELRGVETGILLNSSQFIFNIFEFEKIPFQERLKKELVEWRLKKVFPENIDDYDHNFYQLGKKRILSVLYKKTFKDKIESLFAENDVPLICLGNSTIEIMNCIKKWGRKSPDFLIEIDKGLSMLVFLSKGVPYYIRKFRNEKPTGIVAEIAKTINFIKNNYTNELRSFSLSADPSDIDYQFVKNELEKLNIQPISLASKEEILFSR